MPSTSDRALLSEYRDEPPSCTGRRRVDIGAERGDQTGDIRRAARAAMPDPAMMIAAAGQRVVVEEALAVERQAAQRIVVEGLLHHVGIAAVAFEQRHAMRPEHQADRGAGLGVCGLVGQIVVRGEPFVCSPRAKAAGDVRRLPLRSAHNRWQRRPAGADRRIPPPDRPWRCRDTSRARRVRRRDPAREPARAIWLYS